MKAIDIFERVKWGTLQIPAEFPLDLMDPRNIDTKPIPIVYVKGLGPVKPLLDTDYITVLSGITIDDLPKAAERMVKIIAREGKPYNVGSVPVNLSSRLVNRKSIEIDNDIYSLYYPDGYLVVVEFDDNTYGLVCLDVNKVYHSVSWYREVL